MSYTEYKDLLENDKEKLLTLFYFVMEKRIKQKEEMDKMEKQMKDPNPQLQGQRYVNEFKR